MMTLALSLGHDDIKFYPPTNQAYMYRALLHQDSITYSRMQMYWDTQNRQTPCQSSQSVQSPTTPGQYYL